MIIFPQNNNNINKFKIQNQILIVNHTQNQTQIQVHTQNKRNLKEEKEIFEFNFHILWKNPSLQIIKKFILLQVHECIRLVYISNKIIFNFPEPNEYPLYYYCF